MNRHGRRGSLILLTTAALVSGTVVSAHAQERPRADLPSLTYLSTWAYKNRAVRAYNSRLQVEGSRLRDNQPVELGKADGGKAEIWHNYKVRGNAGPYAIVKYTALGAKVLTAAGSGKKGAAVNIYTWRGGYNQRWAAGASGSGTMMRNGNYDKCLDNPGSSQKVGVNLVVWDCKGGANQYWNPVH
ncbi:RICIN domain-containing protein [Actinomadura roseirufa]|uniref:RICIN domain-containing protein n=1 Tax=Actinomadura roseirufa TaxID=2094049 RepID=UPI0010413614|nr:ricin-type beta-trefoil lectin domain protein [Actinomadura roseirufa]